MPAHHSTPPSGGNFQRVTNPTRPCSPGAPITQPAPKMPTTPSKSPAERRGD